MTLFVVKVNSVTDKNRLKPIGSLATEDKTEAQALVQAIGEVTNGKRNSFAAYTFVRVFLPFGGKIDVRPEDLRGLAHAINETADGVGDWWQP